MCCTVTNIINKKTKTKNRSLQGFKEAIIKHQHLASDFQKEEWGEICL